jgi:radical SAM superfamily enzyme YgiQ (UPF0313 family)
MLCFPVFREVAALARQGEAFTPESYRPARPLRVLFVTLPISYRSASLDSGKPHDWMPFLGPAYVAAAARASGHQVSLLDLQLLPQPKPGLPWDGDERLREKLAAFRPDVVGVSSYLYSLPVIERLAGKVKAFDPSMRVVVGGPNTVVFPSECLATPGVDAVVVGEGEIAFCLLLQAYAEGREPDIDGVWRRDAAGAELRRPRRPEIEPIDGLPMPALDLYPLEGCRVYDFVFSKPAVNIVASRGCPFDCSFCSTRLIFARTMRYHEPARVVAEMNALHRDHGFEAFLFNDDFFTAHRERTLQLCRAIREGRRAEFEWGCWSRADALDEGLLAEMRRAGCVFMMIGVESGSQRLLDRMHKQTTVEQNRRAIEMAQAAGIRVAAGLIVGLPTETQEETRDTIRFVQSARPDFAWFSLAEPHPGTPMWEEAVKTGYFISAEGETPVPADSVRPDDAGLVWVPHGRTRAELRRWWTLADEAGRRAAAAA